MFKERYSHMNAQIQPSAQVLQAVLNAAYGSKRQKSRNALRLKRSAVALTALCICLTLAMPALAATVDPIYRLMYLVSPGTAQFFMPVQTSSEDNGIKMEVVSAYIHDETAEIYVTMQDLTGDRIDKTTDLFDSYSINRPFDSSAHCELAGYEEDTKTAMFLITIDEWGGQNIAGNKITFSVREFLSHKSSYEGLEIPIRLSDIPAAEQTQTVSPNGGGGRDNQGYMEFEKNPIALIPVAPMDAFPVDGIDLTGIAYIDGKLHIQTAVKEPLDNDNHGFFYLKDKTGTQTDGNYSFSFSNQYEQPGRIDYHEYVFDIPRGKLAEYSLYGDFVTSGMKTEGKWRVTFPLENAK